MVQSTKASLYFGNADGFGDWRILIGTNAIKKLREFRISDTMKFKIVYKKLKELSNGQFSDDNQNRLDGNYSGVPIFEARMQQDLRLVYQIDCVADHDVEIERQGSSYKIYGIYTHTQLDGIWDAMSHYLSGKGEEYVQRCKYRNKPILPGAKVSVPAIFLRGTYDVIVEPPPLALGDQEMDQLHSFLAANKYVTFSQALLNGLIAKNDVEHVFELTPQERKIIECTTSCYVLGRSGTGKTTTMLFKMLGIQRAWQLRSEDSEDFDIPRPKQIFVTKSRMLANKVEEYFVKLLQSLSLAGCTLEELARLQSRHVDRGLVDDDDVPDAQSGIPQRYSELEDHHFPLFLTFDQLARMIAADILDTDHPEGQRIAKLFMQSHDPEALDAFVSYEVFVNSYWPHFPQRLTKGQDPWLVFGEIMGIIKGSEKSLEFDDGALDKNTYCGLSSRSNPTFSGQREVVYAIYEAYSKLKRQRQDHDVVDRTHAILKTLQGGASFKGSQVDFLYVDEAQDNLLIDALLLRLLCNNPEGLFWAGDTAQTISAGSSFRFNDLKAFIHRIEADQASHIVRARAVTPPESFQLAINYRSHGGIVNCAHSVIELISRFWPNGIDHLRAEHGIVDGPKPVFFLGWGKDTIHYQQFFGAPGTRIEFGAQQCILVRNEKAKEKFREQVGDIGLIMTLYESKGLEFDDVLLYNFFEDSSVDLSRWRVVLAATRGMVGGHNRSELQVPAFERDENRYAGICSELKVLYVGITRARKRLWIIDKSDKAEPMKLFWSSRSQIQIGAPGTNVSHLAVSSTAEEWAESGRSFFQHKRYTQAIHCFGRANMPREVRIATAYHLREVARATIGSALLTEQPRAFAKAAEAFITCARETPGKEKLQYYRTAADCYVRAADDRKAADAYWDAEEYELAERYCKAEKLKKTVDVPKVESKRMSRDCSDESLTVRRPYHCSKNDEKPSRSLPHSIEEEPEFLATDFIQPGYDDTDIFFSFLFFLSFLFVLFVHFF
ncbi:P-loop containing nucleoside triphosphate hydrolase protein [Pisolithus thermaeus]|nr:P-loop containing nucleoside triphosphate hydrolase protein [Pisolithus thermaeus]